MGSCDKIYIPVFIKIGSGVQKALSGIHKDTQTCRQQSGLISLLYFYVRKLGKTDIILIVIPAVKL
jgi:hypothetical protein